MENYFQYWGKAAKDREEMKYYLFGLSFFGCRGGGECLA